jgi:hypothetical protein
MLPALFDDERQLLLRLATMLCCGALVLLPLTGETHGVASAQGTDVMPEPHRFEVPKALTFPGVAVMRDPFVADPAALPLSGGVRFNGGGSDIGIVLPPNAGADGILPAPTASGIVVRAVVIGSESRALVDSGDGVHVFSIGDRIGNATIVGIDRSGVTLSTGVRLTLQTRTP